MRPSTSWDRKGFGRAVGLALATFLAVGPRAFADDPGPARPGPIGRVFDRFEGFVFVLGTLVDQVLFPAKNPWLDKTVVLKSPRTDLRVDDRPVPMPGGRVFHKFQVRRIEKRDELEWLWLVDGPLMGWVNPSEVVLEAEAKAYFTDQISRGPSTAGAFYLRGSLDGKDGLADLDEAIRLDPKSAAAYVARASVYSQKDDNGRALADLDEAIRLDPALAVAYAERASIHQEKEATGLALADLDEAIRLNPDDATNHAARGQIRFKAKDWASAITDLTEAIRLTRRDEAHAPDCSFLHWYLFPRAEAYRNLADYDRAIADYTETIRLVEALTFLRDESMIFVALCHRADARDSKKDYDGGHRRPDPGHRAGPQGDFQGAWSRGPGPRPQASQGRRRGARRLRRGPPDRAGRSHHRGRLPHQPRRDRVGPQRPGSRPGRRLEGGPAPAD